MGAVNAKSWQMTRKIMAEMLTTQEVELRDGLLCKPFTILLL